MSGLIWIKTVWHSDGVSEFFEKVDFDKISKRQKGMKNYPVGKNVKSLYNG